MFVLDIQLREKILHAINSNIIFCPLGQIALAEDCACKGGCGTYTPPCGCCAYNS